MSEFGYLRVASVSPEVVVGDVAKNTQVICETIKELKKKGVQVAVFPELCVTGYTCADLFKQSLLIDKAKEALFTINDAAKGMAVFVGAPLRSTNGALYNCGVLLNGEEEIGVFPKRFVPNYDEFYEKRWFTPYMDEEDLFEDFFIWEAVKVYGNDNKFTGAVLGCEICEDAWVPDAPSVRLALNGANVIVNLSAGNEVIGKAAYRKELVSMASAKNACAYVYANAGMGESTQDLVFSGHSIICEYGAVLAEKKPFDTKTSYIISDIDIEKLNHERQRAETFSQPDILRDDCLFSEVFVDEKGDGLLREVDGHPFVPKDLENRKQRAAEITNMQAFGLVKRLSHIGAKTAVIGISGGLDSTLAFLVTCKAFDILGLDRKGIIGITMPGFGTTGRTYENAKSLVNNCGASLVEISIKEAAADHLKNLGHSLEVHDITYENAQARERTQVLFDYANMKGGILIGTGDLSELALGWCTYNGDQ
ncbi:MAG: NAD(+) synthase, partial [Lachnospiraceae bacterium]|nr:NAD(+) synthase [Lachnospiraceae bacterium]